MSEIRAAAYVAAKERLDRRRGVKLAALKCNPPNKQCGSRCIPPSWDCRLKGEGPDPHLRAVQTDPLKGLASIERGTKRVIRGITKGSFSDLEGGKAAIIRGAVKIAPGDLQQKQRLKAQLEARTRTIGVGLAVVTGGLGLHALLMRSNPHNYRYTVGAKINEATKEGVNRILDATPLIGQQRARNRSAVEQLVAEAAYRARSVELQGPDALRGRIGTGGEALLAGVALNSKDRSSADNLYTELQRVDNRLSAKNFDIWNKVHRKAFWSVSESTKIDQIKPNIFARPSAERFLAKQYNLTNDEAATEGTIKAALIGRINEDKLSLSKLASQQGFKVKRTPTGFVIDPDEIPGFVSKLTRTSFGTSPSAQSLRITVEKQLIDTLKEPASKVADTIYKDTVKGFNDYYKSVAENTSNISRISYISSKQNELGYSNIIQSADQSRANYLSGLMNLPRGVSGPAHAELVNRAYYATRVAGKSDSPYYVSERLARTAASEIADRPVNTNEEAYRLLKTQYGFTGASRTPIRVPKQPKSNTTTISERVNKILAREGNENMSREAAEKLAKEEASRGDSLPIVRTATYLAVRNDSRCWGL